jgi:hypothetical protein
MQPLAVGSLMVVGVCCGTYIWSSWTGMRPAICSIALLSDPVSSTVSLLLVEISI